MNSNFSISRLSRWFVLVLCMVPMAATAQLSWKAPASAHSGTSQYVEASHSWLPQVTVFKNGWYFTNGDSYSAGDIASDTGTKTVFFDVEATDNSNYEYSSRTVEFVALSNSAPSADISGDTYLVLQNGSATGSWSFSADDPDGNLYRWRVSLAPNTARWSYISGESQSSGFSYTFYSTGTYTFNLDVEDELFESASSSVTIEVVAAPVSHDLSVVSGSGDGSYFANEWAHIVAEDAQSGYEFVGWQKNYDYGPGSLDYYWMADNWFLMGGGDAELEATYQQITEYLTVISGEGSGYYPWGEWVPISANPVPSGQQFAGWILTNGSGSFQDASQLDTYFYTSVFDTTIEATYADILYRLTVTSGDGDGDYAEGRDDIVIRADYAPDGMVFSHWQVVGPGTVQNETSMLTHFTMGNGDVTVTAIYDYLYTLTVVGGTANGWSSGNCLPGTNLTLSAAAPPVGQAFARWTLSGPGSLASPDSSPTGFTTGSGNATVTASYRDVQAPTVPGPFAASSITANSFTLTWSASTDNVGVAAYEIKRGTISLGEAAIPSMNIGGLTPGTSYSMTVRARDAASPAYNWSNWSQPFIVSTLSPAPSVQQAITGASATAFTAKWSPAAGATRYRLDVSASNTFASFVTGFNNLDVGNVTTVAVTGLAPGSTYYYRVRAEYSSATSPNSSVISVRPIPFGVNVHIPY